MFFFFYTFLRDISGYVVWGASSSHDGILGVVRFPGLPAFPAVTVCAQAHLLLSAAVFDEGNLIPRRTFRFPWERSDDGFYLTCFHHASYVAHSGLGFGNAAGPRRPLTLLVECVVGESQATQ